MGNLYRGIILMLIVFATNAIEANAQDAKSLMKEGWIVEPGTKPIVEQLKQVLLAKKDTTVVVAQGFYVANTYNEAYCRAYLNALQDAAKQAHYMMASRNIDDKSSNDAENVILSEKYDITILTEHEMDTNDSADRWNVISMVKVDGYSREYTADKRIERQWYDTFNLENIKVIQSLYRQDEKGRIEVQLTLVIPRKELTIDVCK